MTQPGHETADLQTPQRSGLLDVDDERVVGLREQMKVTMQSSQACVPCMVQSSQSMCIGSVTGLTLRRGLTGLLPYTCSTNDFQ